MIEDSDIELELVIEEERNDLEEGDDNELENLVDSLTAKDGTKWRSSALANAQTINRNILSVANCSLYSPKELFKSFMSPEMCDIILRETNRKA